MQEHRQNHDDEAVKRVVEEYDETLEWYVCRVVIESEWQVFHWKILLHWWHWPVRLDNLCTESWLYSPNIPTVVLISFPCHTIPLQTVPTPLHSILIPSQANSHSAPSHSHSKLLTYSTPQLCSSSDGPGEDLLGQGRLPAGREDLQKECGILQWTWYMETECCPCSFHAGKFLIPRTPWQLGTETSIYSVYLSLFLNLTTLISFCLLSPLLAYSWWGRCNGCSCTGWLVEFSCLQVH